ncbi:hypothetical protein ACFFVB_11030 [Formosa undariae]|uniref:Uncharacterized protein n=1 Tax=Formosa undariae TaxID=1325436 RepID=A0ABV5F2E9_9FLAO
MIKGDLKKIEFIINRLVKYRGRVDMNDLQTYKLYSNKMDDYDIIPDFERILRIIRKYDLAKVIIEPANKCALLNDNTCEVEEIGVENYIEELKNKQEAKSSNSDLKGSTTQTKVQTTDNVPSTKSVIEMISYLIGIITGIILIYEFILKQYI